jgi:hypothetical protein
MFVVFGGERRFAKGSADRFRDSLDVASFGGR